MPNGGPTPDCIHCQSFKGEFTGPWHCHHHQISLAYPIRAFCSHYVRAETAGPLDLLDKLVAQMQLRDDMMYIWLERNPADAVKADKEHFYNLPLALISEYNDWTRERFLEAVAELTDHNR